MSNWAVIPAGDLMATRLGSVDPSKFPNEEFELYSIPAFDSGEPELVPGKAIGSTKQIVQPGDLLLSKIVPHIRRAWIVGADKGKRIIASGEWIVFRSKMVLPQYLKHILVGDQFHAQFMNTVSGVGGSLLRARPSFVAKIGIPVPPKNEQAQIADLLDRADALRAKRREAISLVNSLTQSVFMEMFGDLSASSKWPKAKLKDVAVKITDGTHKTPKYQDSGVVFLSAKNVKNGELNLEKPKFISIEEHQELCRRCNPEKGDIVLTKSGSLGDAAIVKHDFEFSIFESLALIKPKREINVRFLYGFLTLPQTKAKLLQSTKGISIRHLHLVDIRELDLVLPPVKLQNDFEDRLRCIESLQVINARSESNISALRFSLQQRAFAGDL